MVVLDTCANVPAPSSAISRAPSRRSVEFVLLFLTLPLAVAFVQPALIPPLAVLLAVACGAFLALRRLPFDCRRLWRPTRADVASLGFILLRWLAATAVLVALVALFLPDRLFHLPRASPLAWLELLAVYPLLSVLPQEVLYRAYFFQRYRALFGNGTKLILANAAVFAALHLVFANFVALALTFVGGLLFARTYRQSGRLPLVVFEHALYGWTVFTIGLDPYFLGGPLG
jgi:membrane protease YdiL (CAAX protease family)